MKRFCLSCSLAITSLMGIGLVGCGGGSGNAQVDAAQQRQIEVNKAVADSRDQIVGGRKQVGNIVAALQSLQAPNADLKTAFTNLNTQVAEMEKQATSISERSAAMRGKAAEFRNKWEQESATYSNPELKKSAEARADAARARFSDLATLGQDARDDYAPFMKGVKELSGYLANDLSAPSIASAKTVFDKNIGLGNDLGAKLDGIIAKMNEMVPPPPAKN